MAQILTCIIKGTFPPTFPPSSPLVAEDSSHYSQEMDAIKYQMEFCIQVTQRRDIKSIRTRTIPLNHLTVLLAKEKGKILGQSAPKSNAWLHDSGTFLACGYFSCNAWQSNDVQRAALSLRTAWENKIIYFSQTAKYINLSCKFFLSTEWLENIMYKYSKCHLQNSKSCITPYQLCIFVLFICLHTLWKCWLNPPSLNQFFSLFLPASGASRQAWHLWKRLFNQKEIPASPLKQDLSYSIQQSQALDHTA